MNSGGTAQIKRQKLTIMDKIEVLGMQSQPPKYTLTTLLSNV